jgi:Tannase and feruloyl esterase
LTLANTVIDSAVDTPAGTAVVRTCRVHATETTPGADDHIGIDVWMPVSGWNGRFEGVGGGGYSTGSPNSLPGPVNSGFSAGVTDGGHSGISSFTGSFALDSSGRLNWTLIEDFAHRALHDLAVVGRRTAVPDRLRRHPVGCAGHQLAEVHSGRALARARHVEVR